MVSRVVLLSVPVWLILTALLQAPLVPDVHRAIWSLGGMDGRLDLWTLAWVHHALTTDPAGLFDANIFYPARDTLALSNHHIASQLVFAPVRWLSGSAILGLNLLLTVHFIVAAVGTMLLAHRLSGSWAGALLAGAAFAFSPTRMAQLGRPVLLVAGFLPVGLYFLDRFLERRAWRDVAGWSLCLTLQWLSSVHNGYFLVIASLVWAAGHALARPREVLEPRLVLRGLVGSAAAGALALPLTLPYLRVRAEQDVLSVPIEALPALSAGVSSYLATRPDSLLYGRLLALPQPSAGEQWLFPGFLCLTLALLAPLAARRQTVPRARVGLPLALAGIAAVLSFGPEIRLGNLALPAPFLLLWHGLPGFSSFRVPARFGLLVALGLSLAAAGSGRWLAERLAPRGAVGYGLLATAALGLVTLEGAFHGDRPERLPTRTELAAEYRWLAAHGQGPIVELPMLEAENAAASRLRESWYMYHSTYHWRPLVNGYSGYLPPVAVEVYERVAALPAAESVAYLAALGVKHLVVHEDARLHGNLPAIERLPGVTATRFPSGSVVLTLTGNGPHADAEVRLLVPDRLAAGTQAALGVLFSNPSGTHYWVSPDHRACRAEVTWRATGAARHTSALQPLRTPAALAPEERREGVLAVRVPDWPGPARLEVSIACGRGTGAVARWIERREVTLEVGAPATAERQTTGLGARYSWVRAPAEACAGCALPIRLQARNTGTLTWQRGGRVGLGGLWWTGDGHYLSQAGRVALHRDVLPGQEVLIAGSLPAPPAPGRYRLMLDLVQETVVWFRERGSPPAQVMVMVR